MLKRTFIAAAILLAPAAAFATPPLPIPPSQSSVTGVGGAVATGNPYATQAGMRALRDGGNAVDAAVAAAAALGVVEPFASGIGGGGVLLYHEAATGNAYILDGRETAPLGMRRDSFMDKDGRALDFKTVVNSGRSVGVPGTPLAWETAAQKWGRRSLAQALSPAIRLAEDGFLVSEEFRAQVEMNAERFAKFDATRQLYLADGEPPPAGALFRNPGMAKTYRMVARNGARQGFYSGEIAKTMLATIKAPAPGVAGGSMEQYDLDGYQVIQREPVRSTFRGMQVLGAPAPFGGPVVAEALNIIGQAPATDDPVATRHRYLEAARIAFADRGRHVGDPSFVDVPERELASAEFAASRACLITDDVALQSPIAAADPRQPHACVAKQGHAPKPEGASTTHLVASDRWGNIAAYTLTIEQTGGSAILVPGYGFLLNNELTDFDFAPVASGVDGPNLPAPGKRPRSSMAPTLLLENGKPRLVLGSPGGATIITTVLQTLVNRFDLKMPLAEAIAEPRASQRNRPSTDAEPDFLASPYAAKLTAKGHQFVEAPSHFTPTPEIGDVTAIEFLADCAVQAAAEPLRRGGGAAAAELPH